ncbi:uncharacterized protein [Arachis hypogaea]|uniref:uncharacterized protein n=1 Tax=Arachis hypogaea TaxID=3818 RepID=UPI0034E744E4
MLKLCWIVVLALKLFFQGNCNYDFALCVQNWKLLFGSSLSLHVEYHVFGSIWNLQVDFEILKDLFLDGLTRILDLCLNSSIEGPKHNWSCDLQLDFLWVLNLQPKHHFGVLKDLSIIGTGF